MKNLIILGAGTAGTIVANSMVGKLPSGWAMTVVDPETKHLYQPDLLFLPFGMQVPERMERARRSTLARGVEWLQKSVELVDTDKKQVVLDDDVRLDYDLLVIASGSQVRPDETPGLTDDQWQKSIFDFYTLDGARKLRDALATFEGGRVVINLVEMPIKCPVAPLEFAFLADDYFAKRGIRNEVELVYVTPLDAAFTKPIAAQKLGSMLDTKGITVETEFNTGEVDNEARAIRSWDEREIPFDLLVTVPTHMGAPFIEVSGLGDELSFVPTEHHSLKAKQHDDIFIIGDATNLPSSKAGSVAHFQSEVLVKNLLRSMKGQSLVEEFDGHSNCFVETGKGKALLIDFNYDVEPLPGTFPWPVVGPMRLLEESRLNHWGKLAFRWVYWNMLLPVRPLPVSNRMSMAGKKKIAA